MTEPVDFRPAHTPSSQTAVHTEWALAWRNEAVEWVRSGCMSEDSARATAEATHGAIVISREVLGWRESPVVEPRVEYDGGMDNLVAEIIAEELSTVRRELESGADIAVTHIDSPSQRVAHRISCASLESQFDRAGLWATWARQRLETDRTFRLAVPSLFTREGASRLGTLRSCKVCWPNLSGNDRPPARGVFAENLQSHHVSRVLEDEHGLHLGTIEQVVVTRTAEPDRQPTTDSVAVMLDGTTLTFEPRARLRIQSAVETTKSRARENAVLKRVGLPLI